MENLLVPGECLWRWRISRQSFIVSSFSGNNIAIYINQYYIFIMKKLIALALIVSLTGEVFARQNSPQSSSQAKPATQKPADKASPDKDKKKHHHHHHRHHDKPGESKK
jgi:ABC-type nickel/cobalt efflux system permease component RcnA